MSRRTENSKHYTKYKIKGINRCSFLLYWFWHKSHYENVPFEIPESWAWVTLSEVCEVARGGSPRPIKDYLTTNEDGVNWIKIGDTDKDGKYINSTKEKIIPEGVHRSRFVHKGDFLLTNSMSFGRPYILNIDGCIHDGWLVISPFANTYVTEFLYFLLSSSFAYDQFADAASGGVVSNLNSDKVANSYFPLPPEREQRRIINELNNWFKVVGELDQNIQGVKSFVSRIKSKILELAISGKLVPQDIDDEPAIELLKRINPDFKPCDNSHYGNLPGNWEEIVMGEICKLYDGEKVSGPSLTYIDVKYLRGSKVGEFVTSGKYVPQGSTLILVDGENSGEVFTAPIDGYQGSTFKILGISEHLDKEYVLLLIKRSQKLLRENKVGSAIPHLNKKMFKELIVPVPPLAEQKRIVTTVNMLFYKLDMITAEL